MFYRLYGFNLFPYTSFPIIPAILKFLEELRVKWPFKNILKRITKCFFCIKHKNSRHSISPFVLFKSQYRFGNWWLWNSNNSHFRFVLFFLFHLLLKRARSLARSCVIVHVSTIFTPVCNVLKTFSLPEVRNPKVYHLNKSYWAVLSCGTVYNVVQGGSNFWVWMKSLSVTIQMKTENLLSSTFLSCCF